MIMKESFLPILPFNEANADLAFCLHLSGNEILLKVDRKTSDELNSNGSQGDCAYFQYEI